ncbi:MAG: hypothetical protein ACYC2H_12870 [Thermoplasmatota archaeon]
MGIFGSRPQESAKAKDPVCGMTVVIDHAVGPEESAQGPVWFCSVGCQVQYQAEKESAGEGVEA